MKQILRSEMQNWEEMMSQKRRYILAHLSKKFEHLSDIVTAHQKQIDKLTRLIKKLFFNELDNVVDGLEENQSKSSRIGNMENILAHA